MITHEFALLSPATLAEAVILHSQLPGALILGGGTDLVPLMQYDLCHPPALISLNKIVGLDNIYMEGENLVIGAMTRLHSLAQYIERHAYLAGLGRAAQLVASPQIRRIGTVGGNLLQRSRCFYYNQTAQWRQGIAVCIKNGGDICHQAPASRECRAIYCSDLAPALLAAEASVRICGERGENEVALEALFHTQSQLWGGILTHVVIPDTANLTTLLFRKRAVRSSIDFPLANAALAVRADKVRMYVGAMSPFPYALPQTEGAVRQFLVKEQLLPPAVMDSALREARSLSRPVREATVSPAVKRDALIVIQEILGDIEVQRSSRQILY